MEPTFWEQNWFEKALDLLGRPGHAITGALRGIPQGKNVGEEFWKGLSGQTHHSYSDILGDMGMEPGILRGGLGFVGDVALDPLSYVGIGPVRRAATVAIGGVARPLTKIGVQALETVRAAKTAQAQRILTRAAARAAENAPLRVVESGIPNVARVIMPPAAAAGPRLSDARLGRLFAAAGRAAPEVKVLARGMTPEAMRGAEGAKLLGRGFGTEQFGRVFAEKPAAALPGLTQKAIEAPKTLTFGVGRATVPLIPPTWAQRGGELATQGWRKAKLLPVVGKPLRAVDRAWEARGKAARYLFSSKSGMPVADAAVESARDLKNLRTHEGAEWWTNEILQPLRAIAGKDNKAYLAAQKEVVQSLEGILTKIKTLEEPAAKAGIEADIEALSGRLNAILKQKKPLDKVVEKLGEKVRKLKAVNPEQRVLIRDTKGIVEGSEKPAIKAAHKAAKEEYFQTVTTDVIARLEDWKRRTPFESQVPGIRWMDRKGKIAEELRESGVPKHLIRKGAVSYDVAAQGLGYEYGEDLVRDIAKAWEKRQALKAELSDLARATREGSPNPSSRLEYFRGAEQDKAFVERVTKESAVLQGQVDRLESTIATTQASPRRVQLERELHEKRNALAEAKQRLSELKPREVLVQKRVPYESSSAPIQQLAGKMRERFARMLEEEKKFLTLPPEAREFYFPHVMKPEIEQAIKETLRVSPEKILRSGRGGGGASVRAAQRRSTIKGAHELGVNDMIAGGMIDPEKLAQVFEKQGIRISATDMLVFETNPVVAGLHRELAHVRAVTAAEMRDEILNSPTFLKAKANLLDDGDRIRADEIVAQHRDHAVYVTTKDYIENFMTDAQRESLRQGKRPELVRSLAVQVYPDDIDDLVKRVGPGVKKVEAFVLPAEVVDHLNKAHVQQFMPEAMSDFAKIWDQVQGTWKVFATVVRPGFHFRNFLSNLWQNFLAGVRNPQVYFKSAAILNDGWRSKIDKIAGYTPDEIFKLAKEMGVVRTGWVGSAEEFVKRTAEPVGFKYGAGLVHPQGPWARLGSAVGSSIEDNARLANFIDALEKGLDPKSAAWRVKKYMFDYTDLSNVERSYFKRFMPFYTWTRKSVPLAIETLVKDPGKAAMLGKARENFEKNVEAIDRPAVADWIQKSFGVPYKKNPDGTVSYFLLGGLVPTVDLARMDSQQLIGMISPLARAPLESLLNQDFFKGGPITRFPGERQEMFGIPMSPGMVHAIKNIVILAQVDRALFNPDRMSKAEGIQYLLTGTKPERQDPVQQYKRYHLNKEFDARRLRLEAEKARQYGRNVVADALLARADLVEGRGQFAREKALDLNPMAYERAPRPKEPPTSIEAFRARLRGSIDKVKRKAAGL